MLVRKPLLAEQLNKIEYKADINHATENNAAIKICITNLLGLEPDTIDNLMKDNLKALGQILGIEGYAIKDTTFPHHNQMIVQEEYEQKEYLRVRLPDVNNPNVTHFGGWQREKFLLYFLYFMVECYTKLRAKAFENIPAQISKIVNLEKILLNEIWIIVNAYKLYKSYKDFSKPLDLKSGENKENREKTIKESKIIEDLLEEIITNNAPDEFEYVLPCGSREHAVYIVLLYIKAEQKIYARIDDSSSEDIATFEPYGVDQDSKEKLANYLNTVILQLSKENNSMAMDEIYQRYEEDITILSEDKSGYPKMSKQTGPNCIVASFMRGMRFRLNIKGTSNDEIFSWLFREVKRFAVDNIGSKPEPQPIYADQLASMKSSDTPLSTLQAKHFASTNSAYNPSPVLSPQQIKQDLQKSAEIFEPIPNQSTPITPSTSDEGFIHLALSTKEQQQKEDSFREELKQSVGDAQGLSQKITDDKDENLQRQQLLKSLEMQSQVQEPIGIIEHYFTVHSHFPDEKNGDTAPLFEALKANQTLWGVIHDPVYLNLICLAYAEGKIQVSDLKQSLSLTEIYQLIVNLLLQRYQEKLNGTSQIIPEPLTAAIVEQKEDIQQVTQFLEEFAYHSFTQYDFILDNNLLMECLKKTNQPLTAIHTLVATGILKEVNDQGKPAYQFTDTTLQKFFAARYLARKLQQPEELPQDMIERFNQYKHTPSFAMMLWFTAGLLQNKPLQRFIQLLQATPHDEIGLYHLGLIMRCVAEAGYPKELTAQVNQHLDQLVNKCWIAIKEGIVSKDVDNNVRAQSAQLALKWLEQQHLLTPNFELAVSSLNTIIKELSNTNWPIRYAAAKFLGTLRTPIPAAALDGLKALQNDEHPYVQKVASDVLERVHGVLKASTLQTSQSSAALPNNHDSKIKQAPSEAKPLEEPKTPTTKILQHLFPLLKIEDSDARHFAAQTLNNYSIISLLNIYFQQNPDQGRSDFQDTLLRYISQRWLANQQVVEIVNQEILWLEQGQWQRLPIPDNHPHFQSFLAKTIEEVIGSPLSLNSRVHSPRGNMRFFDKRTNQLLPAAAAVPVPVPSLAPASTPIPEENKDPQNKKPRHE